MRLVAVTLAVTLAAAPLAAQPEPGLASADGLRVGVAPAPVALPALPDVRVPDDTGRRRAVQHSDLYYKRLTVHRYASYTMLPLFAVQYALGNKLIDAQDRGTEASSSVRNAHSLAAGTIAGLFGLNTVTGAWNWWDERKEPEGKARRTVHSLLMLTADAGFVATGVVAGNAQEGGDDARTHRNVALGSMAVATAGAALMWFWKD